MPRPGRRVAARYPEARERFFLNPRSRTGAYTNRSLFELGYWSVSLTDPPSLARLVPTDQGRGPSGELSDQNQKSAVMPREPEHVLVDHFLGCHQGPCFGQHPGPGETYGSFLRERANHIVGALRRSGFDEVLAAPQQAVSARSRDQKRSALRGQLRWRRRAKDAEYELHDLRDRISQLAEEWHGLASSYPDAKLAASDLEALLEHRMDGP